MGNKAINFLEWVLDSYQRIYDIDRNQLLPVLTNFYSQPFKPEMITEYFEGWDQDSDRYYNGVSGNIQGCVRKFKNGSWKIYNGKRWHIWGWQTLNDFISDCQRAGIELIWKQEIIDKYFK